MKLNELKPPAPPEPPPAWRLQLQQFWREATDLQRIDMRVTLEMGDGAGAQRILESWQQELEERRKKSRKKKKRPQARRFQYGVYGGWFYPGFHNDSGADSSSSGADGGGGESIREQAESRDHIIDRFAASCAEFLALQNPPRIRLRRDPEWTRRNGTFGRYTADPHNHIELATTGRHIIDILRTLAHEMTHAAQNERTGLPDDAGETGSRFEDEANAMAGRIMRHWAEQEPELFRSVELEEGWRERAAAVGAAACVAGTPGCATTGTTATDALRTIQTVGRAAQNLPTRAGAEEELRQELGRIINRGRGTHAEPRIRESSGYIPTAAEKHDPRFSMALTQDVRPGETGRQANRLGLKTDSQGRPNLLMKKLTNLLESIKDETPLTEVDMSPGALERWAQSDAARKVRVGFEFEMYFPNTEGGGGDDDKYGDGYDPETPGDERTHDIEGIIEFFREGTNPPNEHQLRLVREQLEKEYQEWRDDLIDSEMIESRFYGFMTASDAVEKQREKLTKQYREQARQELGSDADDSAVERLVQTMWRDWTEQQWNQGTARYMKAFRRWTEKRLDEQLVGGEGDWLDRWGGDYTHMSDVARTFGLLWPYPQANNQTSGKAKPRTPESWAQEFADVIGMPVRTGGYHGTRRGQGWANLERDSSLDRPSSKSDAGLELITPYRPLPEALQILHKVTEFARDNGIYTKQGGRDGSGGTGLHMNVSLADVPNVDWVKLVLFMGDQRVLDQFARQANHYTQSSLGQLMDQVRQRQSRSIAEDPEDQAIYDAPMDINRAMDLMRGNMIELAQRAVQSGLGADKYQSVHVKPLRSGGSYIEFRGPGGDWLRRQSTVRRRIRPGFTGPPRPVDILQDTVFRLGRAMTIAADPEAEREEYARKLYRVLTPDNPNLRDPIRMFARYNAGEITRQQLKLDWADAVLRAQDTATATGAPVPARQQRRQDLAQRVADKDTWWKVSANNTGYDLSNQGIPGWIRAGTPGQAIKKFRERNQATQNFSADLMTAVIDEPRPLQTPPPEPQTIRGRTFYQTYGQSGHNWAIADERGGIYDTFPAPTDAAAQDRLRSYQNEHPGRPVWLVPLAKDPDLEGKPSWRLTWTYRRGREPANVVVRANSARQALDLIMMRDTSARTARDMRVEPYQPETPQPARSSVMGPPRQNINDDPYANYAIIHVQDNRVVLPFRRDNDREALEFYQEWVKERINPRGYQLVPFLPPVGWRDPDLTESQELTEVEMNPGAFRRFLASPEAAGIRAGFEAELIFRDVQSDEGGESEPNYDVDQRAGSIADIIDFFTGGDNGITGRQAQRLENDMQEQYMDWVTESFDDNYFDLDRFQEWADDVIWPEVEDQYRDHARENLDDPDASDEDIEKEAIALFHDDVERNWDRRDQWHDRAREELYDEYAADQDESDWLESHGLRWMSNVADAYNLDWPYWTEGAGGNREWAGIGASLERATGLPVRVGTGYHSTRRRPGEYVIEPDSSLDADDEEDFGLEIVSPPLPLPEAIEQLRRVIAWANDSNEGNAYTNSSTGLHMGVSLPYKGGDVDPIKLILFMGDKNLLETFGRESNTYARSAYDRLTSRIKDMRNAGPQQISGIMNLMRRSLIELADRDLKKGVLGQKYVSVNPHDGYIEFRGPGGDYLAKNDEIDAILENTMMRLAYAMHIAGRPDLYRDEYAKKLYKVLTGYKGAVTTKSGQDTRYRTEVETETDDPFMRLFSDYSAGTLSGPELKRRWAKAVVDMENKKDTRDTIQTEPPALEPRSKTGARRAEKARKILDRPLVWHVEDTNDGRVILVRASGRGEARQEARRIDTGFERLHLNDPDSFLVQPATAAETQQYLQQQADAFADSHELQARLGAASGTRSDPNALAPGEQDWLVRWSEYRDRNGREELVHDSLRTVARTAAEASERLIDTLAMQGRVAFNVRSEPTDPPAWRAPRPLPTSGEPIPGSTLDIQRQRQQAAQQNQGEFTGRWQVRNANTGDVLETIWGIGNSQAEANRNARAWAQRNGVAHIPLEVVPEMR